MLGICVQIVAILNFVFLIEYPNHKGIQIKEKANIFKPDSVEQEQSIMQMDDETREEDIEDSEDIKNIAFKDALLVPGVLQFSFSFFFIKFAYYGVYYWVPDYL